LQLNRHSKKGTLNIFNYNSMKGFSMSNNILVTGATGSIGSQVAKNLAENKSNHISAFVRDLNKASKLKEAGVNLFQGSFEDVDSVKKAFTGNDTIVLIVAPNENASKQMHTAITVAKECGVRKIVRISAVNAQVNGPTDNTHQHGITDNELIESGLTYVILRPHFFMQNLMWSIQNIAQESNMYWGMGDGRLSMVDVRDIVDCVEKCALVSDFDNKIFTPVGPESITFHQVAEAFTEALGKKVNYVPVPPEAVEQSILGMGMDAWFAKVMKNYSAAYGSNLADFVNNDIQEITGHPARSINQFANEVLKPMMGNIQ
jgi:uncharacterized protein YbjT (DUF2867 family)